MPSFPSSSKMGITWAQRRPHSCGLWWNNSCISKCHNHSSMGPDEQGWSSNFVLIFSYEYKHYITEGFKNKRKKLISIPAYKITTTMKKKKLYPNKRHYTVFEKSLPATLTMTWVFYSKSKQSQRSMVDYSPQGCKELDTTECAHTQIVWARALNCGQLSGRLDVRYPEHPTRLPKRY